MGLNKSIYTSRGSGSAFKVEKRSIDDLYLKLYRYAKEYEGFGGQTITSKAADPIVRELRTIYFGPSRERTFRGSTIYPGNLAKSFYKFRSRRFKRERATVASTTEVGPKFRTPAPKEMGKTSSKASGFYAAALASSATLFRQQYMEPTVGAVSNQAIQAAEEQVTRIHKKFFGV